MSDSKKNGLSDAELEQVSGGYGLLKKKNIRDGNGRLVGFVKGDKILYHPCGKCGKPLHCGMGVSWFCDPCNAVFMPFSDTEWGGSKEELIEAAS